MALLIRSEFVTGRDGGHGWLGFALSNSETREIVNRSLLPVRVVL